MKSWKVQDKGSSSHTLLHIAFTWGACNNPDAQVNTPTHIISEWPRVGIVHQNVIKMPKEFQCARMFENYSVFFLN